jgi:hypothetical protein
MAMETVVSYHTALGLYREYLKQYDLILAPEPQTEHTSIILRENRRDVDVSYILAAMAEIDEIRHQRYLEGVERRNIALLADNQAYRKLAKKLHPDNGGDTILMQRLNEV